jgi:hypothetical protein
MLKYWVETVWNVLQVRTGTFIAYYVYILKVSRLFFFVKVPGYIRIYQTRKYDPDSDRHQNQLL